MFFGYEMPIGSDYELYHGTSSLKIPKNITIVGAVFPVSLTTDKNVAKRFAGCDGCVLTFGIKKKLYLMSIFNCEWLSGYEQEKERLVCGSLLTLIDLAIYQLNNRAWMWMSYKPTIDAIRLLCYLRVGFYVSNKKIVIPSLPLTKP